MVIVPLMAMFSHKIPTQARAAAREQLWNPVQQAILSALDMESNGRPANAPVAALTTPPPFVPVAAAVLTPADGATAPNELPGEPRPPTAQEILPPLSPAPLERIEPVALEPVTLPMQSLAPPPAPTGRQVAAALASATKGAWHAPGAAPAQPGGRPQQATFTPAADISPLPDVRSAVGRQALEDRLRKLGALAFEWTPLTAGDVVHRCSCSLAVDPAGQLHRVFQGAGTDPTAAADNLLAQIDAWQRTRGTQRLPTARAALDASGTPPPY